MTRTLPYATFLMGVVAALLLSAGESPEPFSPGLTVGTEIPAFEVVDKTGKSCTFADLRGSKGALFVFYRSAKW